MPEPVLRLYVLGALDTDKQKRTLTIFAEYKALRGLSRVYLKRAEVAALVSSIGSLRGYVEGGYPETDPAALQGIGARLFDILIRDKTKEIFLLATGQIMGTNKFLPLEIVAEDFEIAGWPWEYLYNSSSQKFIAQDLHPISRSIFSTSSHLPSDAKKGRVKILMILGVPPDDPNTTPAEEIKVIMEVFGRKLGADNFDIQILPAAGYAELQKRISEEQPGILHYFGHAGFDYQQREGFLSITRPGSDPFKIYAKNLANLLIQSHVRFVFLNACKTAQTSQTDNPGRSSVAATLLDAGIPAVVGTQFSLPDMSAHTLSATIYSALLTGQPIGEAVRTGRNGMFIAPKAKFFDWGIPVLYSTHPAEIIFPPESEKLSRADDAQNVISGRYAAFVSSVDTQSGAPAAPLEPAQFDDNDKKVKVALLDIDAKVGFLSDLAQLANKVQSYYDFEVIYRPVPSGYVRTDMDGYLRTLLNRLLEILHLPSSGSTPQTFLPRLVEFLRPLADELNANYVCGLTQNMVAGEREDGSIFHDYFTSSLLGDYRVFIESTFDLRRYARQAGIPFTKAVLVLCLGQLVAGDARWSIKYHKETAGCLFDFCGNRNDIVVGLKKTTFDHKVCRAQIKDAAQLEAVDRILALDFSEPIADG